MQKTNIKITILLILSLLAGLLPVSLVFASEITANNVIDLINKERIKENIPVLVENSVLSKVAEAKAKDMLKFDYFAHTSPSGVTPWFWFQKEGYEYEFAGENLAINFKTAEKQNEALMNSPTHRKNILSNNFNEIGVAVIEGTVGGKNAIITVQEFGYQAELPAVAGQSSGKIETSPSVKNEQNVVIHENKQFVENDNYFAGIVSSLNPGNFLKLTKGLFSVSAFILIILIFSSFIHKISKLKEFFSKIDRQFFANKTDLSDIANQEHKMTLKFFPIEMKKIEVTHLHHMKQRE